ncbi:MAG: hypothetical protein AAFV88_01530 [Planctomycetota bacterium]
MPDQETNASNPTAHTNRLSGIASTESAAEDTLQYASDAGVKETAAPSLELPRLDPDATFESRCSQAMECAEIAFASTASWVVFFREMLGPKGVVRKLFGGERLQLDSPDMRRFEQSEYFVTLNEIVAAIRSQDDSKSNAAEPERMITIRIPRSLHEQLKEEAKLCKLSINKLSISKLLQPTNPRFVPEQRGKLRGRRPGPQPPRERSKATSYDTSSAVANASLEPGESESDSVGGWNKSN